MSLIQVNDLSFSYDGSYEPVFEHVSFQIDTNWKLGFTGRNGRGKTTFLRLLLGEFPYQGTISASVPFSYFPFSVKRPESLAIEAAEKMNPTYEFWRLQREMARLRLDEAMLYRPYATLSGGEQTKLQLAVLFSSENNFLLIDEPTNHLDLQGRELVSKSADPRRADEPPRLRYERALSEGAAPVRRHHSDRLPRPRLSRRLRRPYSVDQPGGHSGE